VITFPSTRPSFVPLLSQVFAFETKRRRGQRERGGGKRVSSNRWSFNDLAILLAYANVDKHRTNVRLSFPPKWQQFVTQLHGTVNSPVDAVVFPARAIAADRTQVLAARQRVIRRIRRFALATGRRTQDVAVTTSIEGSLHAKQRTTVYESTTSLHNRKTCKLPLRETRIFKASPITRRIVSLVWCRGEKNEDLAGYGSNKFCG